MDMFKVKFGSQNSSTGQDFSPKARERPREKDWFELHNLIKTGELPLVTNWFMVRCLSSSARQFWTINSYWPLQTATKAGHLHIFDTLISFGFDPLEKDFFGDGLVHSAARSGHQHMLERFHHLGLSLSVRDEDDNTPLHTAVGEAFDNTKVIKYLLQRADDIDARNCFFETPLHVAARKGSLSNVRMLTHLGSFVNALTPKGLSPLYFALHRCQEALETATLLCDAGAVSNGSSEFYAATLNMNTPAIALLLERNFLIGRGRSCDSSRSPLMNIIAMPNLNERTISIDMIMNAGYDIRADISWIRELEPHTTKLEAAATLQRQLLYYVSQPMSLLNLSCLVIRKSLGHKLHSHIESLPIPEVLKNTIKLRHVLHIVSDERS